MSTCKERLVPNDRCSDSKRMPGKIDDVPDTIGGEMSRQ